MGDSFSNFLNKIDINSAVSFLFQIHFKVYLRYVFIYPQYCTIFISAEKKTYSYCERRIFSSSRADNFWRCVFVYPQYWKIFICAKKNLEDKQTNRQTTFHTRLSSENGSIIKKKEIQFGTQLKVK